MIESVTSAKSMESWNYAYDDLNRLLSATNVDTPTLTQTFQHDEIGNITYNSQIGTYAYPAPGNPRPHAVQTAESRTYQYNAAGQMTNRNGMVIQWNGDGKPSSIGNVGFVYDGVGTRLKKLSGGQTTKYVGGNYEIAPDGTVTKYLVGGKQVGTSFFIHHRDHLGSIQAVTDATGAEVRRQKHKPFGDQHYAWGSHLESKGWIGEREEETELLYLNARYYDPEIARFISADLIARVGQGLNRYAYSINNPINFLDPGGLDHEPSHLVFRVKVEACGPGSTHPRCTGIPTYPPRGPNRDGFLDVFYDLIPDGRTGRPVGERPCSFYGYDCYTRPEVQPGSGPSGPETGSGNGTGQGNGGSGNGNGSGTGNGSNGTGTGTGTSTGSGTVDDNNGEGDSHSFLDDLLEFDPDFMVFGASVSGFTPIVLGGGAGIEGVSFAEDRFDIWGYTQTNKGLGVPGPSGSLFFGFGWHATTAPGYTGTFKAVSFGWPPLGGQYFWSDSGTHGFQISLYGGTPGVSGVKECYQFLNPSNPAVVCK